MTQLKKEPNPRFFGQEQKREVGSNAPKVRGSGSELKWKGSGT